LNWLKIGSFKKVLYWDQEACVLKNDAADRVQSIIPKENRLATATQGSFI
jgi:hypothetical protein